MASACKGDPEELRIVLLGVSGAGKSSIGNAILGREVFKETTTRESEKQRGRVEDRNISIIDTPGFFNPHLNEEELQSEMMKSFYLCYPGPHVFLLITNLENFEEDQRNIVEEILGNIGKDALLFTMVLFIGRERITNKKWKLFMESRKFQNLVGHCSGRCHAMNSKNDIIPTHITKLLEKMDEIINENHGQHYDISTYLRTPIKSSKKKKHERKVKVEKMQEQTKIEQETTHIHSVKKKTRDKTKIETTEPYEDRCFRVHQETKNDEEEAVKQPETSWTHSFENVGEKNTVQKLGKCWKMRGPEKFDQREQPESIEQYSTQADAEFSQNRQVKAEKSTDLRIVLVGKTGAGKSSTGNTILRRNVFKEDLSSESVTKECEKHQQTVEGRNISVIDTPGLFDTKISEEELRKEIEKCVEMSVPGPHVFLLVIRLDVRFTYEEENTVKWIQENFGEEASRYTIVLFTRGDQLKTTIVEFLNKNNPIRQLVKQCKGGYRVFNNTDEEDRSQVTELLEKIDRMVMKNRGQFYTNEMYREAQRKIWEEEKRQREEEERMKLEEKEKIKEEEKMRLMNIAKNVAVVGTGVAVGTGVMTVSGVTLNPCFVSGAMVAGGAALASVAKGGTLSDALKAGAAAAGNAALVSLTSGESLPGALMGARSNKSS